MKRWIGIILFASLLLLPRPSGSQQETFGRLANAQATTQGAGERINPSDEPPLPYPYEPTILSSKLFQKNLPPLKRKERILWSFRTAKANIFL